MEHDNRTTVSEFILIAFQDLHQYQVLLFILIVIMYITCIVGNIVIYVLICFEYSLHTPMYYFIRSFAVLEIIFVSIIVPKLLDNLIAGKNHISFIGCFAQLYCANTTGIVESYLLTVMVFDRHLAITKPLHYSVIMSQACTRLIIFPWIVGFTAASIPIIVTARLDFCGPKIINHFFCDFAPLQSLCCCDPVISNHITMTAGIFVALLPFVIIIVLYTQIINTVLKINSVEGKHKAFSTCSSHLIVASLFFGTGITVYVKPNANKYDKYFALIYTVVTPLLNPFIYTLRNNDVKEVFLKYLKINVK